MPEDFGAFDREFTFNSFDGTELFARVTTPTKPRALVLIVHGLCEHQGRYDYLAARLVAQQYGVFRFDHRGHGRSAGERIYYNDFNEIVDDVNAAFEKAQAEVPGLPTFVIGHSMGGYAATLFATKYPDKATGIILSGALTRYNNPLMGPFPMPGDPHDRFPNALGDGICSDPSTATNYELDPLVGKDISVGLCNSFEGGLAYLKAEAARFTAPALIMHGAADGLVAEADSRELYGEIGSADKSLRIYAGLMHEIFNEYRKDEVIADLLLWISQHL
ncbi:MAG: lysophospholipase [Bifidobacteriaceae bacterium]|jgi:lysophospholipase|nr:lysophospholipase [Bifidobacteriaceae bacterium]